MVVASTRNIFNSGQHQEQVWYGQHQEQVSERPTARKYVAVVSTGNIYYSGQHQEQIQQGPSAGTDMVMASTRYQIWWWLAPGTDMVQPSPGTDMLVAGARNSYGSDQHQEQTQKCPTLGTIHLANVELPNVELPNVELLNVELPNTELPNVELPNAENYPTSNITKHTVEYLQNGQQNITERKEYYRTQNLKVMLFFFILFYFKGTASWISLKRYFVTTLEPKLVVMCKKN